MIRNLNLRDITFISACARLLFSKITLLIFPLRYLFLNCLSPPHLQVIYPSSGILGRSVRISFEEAKAGGSYFGMVTPPEYAKLE